MLEPQTPHRYGLTTAYLGATTALMSVVYVFTGALNAPQTQDANTEFNQQDNPFLLSGLLFSTLLPFVLQAFFYLAVAQIGLKAERPLLKTALAMLATVSLTLRALATFFIYFSLVEPPDFELSRATLILFTSSAYNLAAFVDWLLLVGLAWGMGGGHLFPRSLVRFTWVISGAVLYLSLNENIFDYWLMELLEDVLIFVTLPLWTLVLSLWLYRHAQSRP